MVNVRSNNSKSNIHNSTFIIGVAITVFAALLYANALGNGLVWDDPIVLDRQLLAFRGMRDLIFTPRNIPQYSPDYYRPLTTLSYLIDRAVGGTGPFMFHLSVVAYHVVATYLVFRLGLVLFRGTAVILMAAGVGAAIFAVHPIHTESVAWGAGRSDVIACCFALAGALAYLRDDWTPLRRASVAAALVFAAMLAKETAVTLLVILPASDAILGRRPVAAARPVPRAERRRQRDQKDALSFGWLPYAPLAAALVLYTVLRQATLGTMFGQASPPGATGAAKLVGAVGLYIRMLVAPIQQCAYISDLPAGALALMVTAALLAASALGAVVLWRRRERPVCLLLLWIGVTLAPSLAIVLKIPNAPVAERYLYLPSAGFCLLCGYGAARALAAVRSRAARAAVAMALAALITGGAAATVRRNAVWRSNLSLWTDTAAKNATDGLPMRSLAAAYLDLGDTMRATELFRQALERRNDQVGKFTIYNNLGSLAMREKNLDEAERYYSTALSIDPNAPEALFNMGLIALTRATDAGPAGDAALKRARAQRARRQFERAVALSPLDPDIHVALGQTLQALGEAAGARARYERALALGLPPATETLVRKLLAELR
jgi:tetratricopeptide (TPR) repeat protein